MSSKYLAACLNMLECPVRLISVLLSNKCLRTGPLIFLRWDTMKCLPTMLKKQISLLKITLLQSDNIQLSRYWHPSKTFCLCWRISSNYLKEHQTVSSVSVSRLYMVYLHTIESMSTSEWHRIDYSDTISIDVDPFLVALLGRALVVLGRREPKGWLNVLSLKQHRETIISFRPTCSPIRLLEQLVYLKPITISMSHNSHQWPRGLAVKAGRRQVLSSHLIVPVSLIVWTLPDFFKLWISLHFFGLGSFRKTSIQWYISSLHSPYR